MLRLSPSNSFVITTDTTTNVLHYTDGIGDDWTLDLAGLSGEYDVFFDGAILTARPFATARDATWVGSINVAVPGQLTCHVSLGQTRQWDIFNVFNQKEINLISHKVAPDGQYFGYNPPLDFTWHVFNDDRTIRATVFTGSPETVKVRYSQTFWIQTGPNLAALCSNGIGWNIPPTGILTPTGTVSAGNIDDIYHATGRTFHAFHTATGVFGINTVHPLVQARGPSANIFLYGGDYRSEPNKSYQGSPDHFMNLTVTWMG